MAPGCCASVIMSPSHLIRNVPFADTSAEEGGVGKDTDAREVGRRLGVGAVLEGSVRKSGDRLRISAQLIDTAGGFHVWCEQYDRTMTDVFDLQDEISRSVIGALRSALLKDGTPRAARSPVPGAAREDRPGVMGRPARPPDVCQS